MLEKIFKIWQKSGYDTKILDSQDFVKFKSKFSSTEPITDIIDMYNKINGTEKKEAPQSPGSAKSSMSNNLVKEFYTPDEVRQLTEEDLDNPKIMEAVEKSMARWKK